VLDIGHNLNKHLKMKVRMLCRNPSDFRRETADDIFKIPRNQKVTEHPFFSEREYVRAMNAAKLGRMMAKPFLGALEGTHERVTTISLNTETLGVIAVRTTDGKIQSWDIAKRNKLAEVLAHENEVRGICHFSKSRLMYTVGLLVSSYRAIVWLIHIFYQALIMIVHTLLQNHRTCQMKAVPTFLTLDFSNYIYNHYSKNRYCL
ncbi:hypothetical protein MN116_000158, partial [Schistosoma mekongi]